jgi:methionyl-tRNA synthetase
LISLINPYSTISGSTDLEMRDTKHLYLLQSMKDDIEAWIDSQTGWPMLTSIAKMAARRCKDRGITRDSEWGACGDQRNDARVA